MSENQSRRSPSAPLRASSAITLIAAAPYALTLIYYGLRSIAWGSKPRVFGVSYNSDSGSDFPQKATLVIGFVVVIIGLALVASLVAMATDRIPAVRWAVLGWLLLAIVAVSAGARNPGEGRRCFIDRYSESQVCYSAKTIVVRDTLLRSTPAAVAAVAVCSLLNSTRRKVTPEKT